MSRRTMQREAMFLAAECGNVGALRAALRPRGLWWRAGVNVRNKDGWTPLHYAAAYGHLAVAQALLERGAQAEARNYLGLTPLDYAACYGHAALAELLVEHGARHTLHSAAALGVTWALGHLLARGACLEEHDYFGYTPLHWAARHGRQEAARMLLDRGAEPNARNVNGETSLQTALHWHQDAVAQLLRQRGGVAECQQPRALTG